MLRRARRFASEPAQLHRVFPLGGLSPRTQRVRYGTGGPVLIEEKMRIFLVGIGFGAATACLAFQIRRMRLEVAPLLPRFRRLVELAILDLETRLHPYGSDCRQLLRED